MSSLTSNCINITLLTMGYMAECAMRAQTFCMTISCDKIFSSAAGNGHQPGIHISESSTLLAFTIPAVCHICGKV